MYTSKTIQNELIHICGNIICNKILDKIRKAGYFSAIADEATDTQMMNNYLLVFVTMMKVGQLKFLWNFTSAHLGL